MDTLNTQIKEKILEFLKTKRIGASSSDISKSIGHNRITVTKYLEIMKAHKLLAYEGVAQAKLWYIIERRSAPVVLIVDDDPHIVELIALSLIPDKYTIIKAYSGLEALDRISKESPDLIILDLMMPGIDGFEVCRKVKEHALTQAIPVIILTAKGELDDKLKGLRMGADDYLTKPFDPLELEARVDRMIRRTSQDQDMHPLSRMPGRNAIRDALRKRIHTNSRFIAYNLSVGNLALYNKAYGTRRGDHVVTFMSRILADAMDHDDVFVGHTVKDNFVVVCPDGHYMDKVNKLFAGLLPYLCDSKGCQLKLDVSSMTSQEMQSKHLNADSVLDALGVN
jgi:DNA-binding response OmpR family regulator